MQQFGRNGYGGLFLFEGGEAGSPSNTMSPGLRPTSVPSGILTHSAVWPQYTNVTDRQDKQVRQQACKTQIPPYGLSRCHGVAVSGPEEATSGLAKLFPVEKQPLPVSQKPQIPSSELAGQQSESLWTAEKYSR